ncbi:hypothetical protein [Schlesneria sp. DSM 10557]|uniref:hypothetical protein n=1 Tax=Schlesneria sp. DSM 10557 TaxID=3044399 RepID=UPI00359FBA5F
MGGPGSGRVNDSRPRRPAAAVNVIGSGVPAPITELRPTTQAAFDRIVEMTSGVSFSQDSIAVEMAARLLVRLQVMDDAIADDPSNFDLHRLSLAVGRQLAALLSKFGLTPRDRQVLMVPRDEPEEEDPLETLRKR